MHRKALEVAPQPLLSFALQQSTAICLLRKHSAAISLCSCAAQFIPKVAINIPFDKGLTALINSDLRPAFTI